MPNRAEWLCRKLDGVREDLQGAAMKADALGYFDDRDELLQAKHKLTQVQQIIVQRYPKDA
jgi:hypothetical protein